MSQGETGPTESTRIAVAVVVDRRRLLVGRRPLGESLSGYAEFPGGKVEEGESFQDAAKRECMEETGLLISVGDELDVAWQRYEHADVEIHFFYCTVIGRTIQRQPFEWVPVERLSAYRFPPANAEVLRKIAKRLEQ